MNQVELILSKPEFEGIPKHIINMLIGQGRKFATEENIEKIKLEKNTGLGKYSNLKKVLQSQKEFGGRKLVSPEQLASAKNLEGSKITPGGDYEYDTRKIRINETLDKPTQYRVKRHELAHDIQNVGKQLKTPVSSNWERLTWLNDDSKLKEAIGSLLKETQARAVELKSTPKGLLDMAIKAPGYAKIAEEPIEKNLYKAIGVLSTPAQAIENAIKMGAPQKALSTVGTLGRGIVTGAAQAPAFEFMNPPSLGPVEGTPEYELEMGRITMDEFKRLKQRENNGL